MTEPTCTCVPCSLCDGTGNIWVDGDGRYLGMHRCDDMAEMEPCPACRGRGIEELCEKCANEPVDGVDGEEVQF